MNGYYANDYLMLKQKQSNKYKQKKNNDYWVFGKHAVIAAIKNKERIINKVLISNTKNESFLSHIKEQLNLYKKNVKIEIKNNDNFKRIFSNKVHQGIAANVKKLKNLHLSKFLQETNNQNCFAVFLYKIQDPHNLGAIIRSAVAFNFKYILLNKRNSSKETNTVAKVSSGGIDNINLVNVSNVFSTLKKLKENNWLIIALDTKAKMKIYELDKNIINTEKILIILGSENKGISKSFSKFFDFCVNIPIDNDNIDSLNVSNAAAITFFQINKTLLLPR